MGFRMNLLELLPQLEEYGRVKRKHWHDRFILKPIDGTEPMINCNMECLIMDRFLITFNDLIAEDWEIIK